MPEGGHIFRLRRLIREPYGRQSLSILCPFGMDRGIQWHARLRSKRMTLAGKKIAILIAPRGTEDPEFAQPKSAVEKAGAQVRVVGLQSDDAETVSNDLDPASKYKVDMTVDQVSVDEFDGLVIPGGCVGAISCERMKRLSLLQKRSLQQESQ